MSKEKETVADIAAEADELAVGGIVEAGRNRERCNSAAMREALEKLKEAYFENDDGFARIDCSIVPDFEGLIDAALAAPARNCDKYANRYWLDEFEKQMGKTPSKTADEQDEYMKENWFLFYHWLSNPATEKEGGAKILHYADRIEAAHSRECEAQRIYNESGAAE